MFKGYRKTDTSGRNMLRIEKRERLLGIAIVAGKLVSEPDKAPGMTKMELAASDHHDLLDWEMQLIAETNWIHQEPEVTRIFNTKWVTYRDTNKIRIYHKWLYRNNLKTLKQVLKYMYSPLFAALLLMHRGDYKGDAICLDFYYHDDSIKLLKQWFKDILDINCCEGISDWSQTCLIFEHENKDKLLAACEPIVKQVPSMYAKFYSALAKAS